MQWVIYVVKYLKSTPYIQNSAKSQDRTGHVYVIYIKMGQLRKAACSEGLSCPHGLHRAWAYNTAAQTKNGVLSP